MRFIFNVFFIFIAAFSFANDNAGINSSPGSIYRIPGWRVADSETVDSEDDSIFDENDIDIIANIDKDIDDIEAINDIDDAETEFDTIKWFFRR